MILPIKAALAFPGKNIDAKRKIRDFRQGGGNSTRGIGRKPVGRQGLRGGGSQYEFEAGMAQAVKRADIFSTDIRRNVVL